MLCFPMIPRLKRLSSKANKNVSVKSAAPRFLPTAPEQNIALNAPRRYDESSRRNGQEGKGVQRRHFEAQIRCAATDFFANF